MKVNDVMDLVYQEILAQNKQWGPQKHDDATWFLILSEEVGELATGILNNYEMNIKEEAVQVAAVVINWLAQRKER